MRKGKETGDVVRLIAVHHKQALCYRVIHMAYGIYIQDKRDTRYCKCCWIC